MHALRRLTRASGPLLLSLPLALAASACQGEARDAPGAANAAPARSPPQGGAEAPAVIAGVRPDEAERSHAATQTTMTTGTTMTTAGTATAGTTAGTGTAGTAGTGTAGTAGTGTAGTGGTLSAGTGGTLSR